MSVVLKWKIILNIASDRESLPFAISNQFTLLLPVQYSIVSCPHRYFANAHPDRIGHVFDINLQTVLPHRDNQGRRVYIYKPGRWDPDRVSFAGERAGRNLTNLTLVMHQTNLTLAIDNFPLSKKARL